jgi:hypothetical protein
VVLLIARKVVRQPCLQIRFLVGAQNLNIAFVQVFRTVIFGVRSLKEIGNGLRNLALAEV